MPLVTDVVTKLPSYAEKQKKVDSLEHERCGASLMEQSTPFDPSVARQALINTLRPLHALFPPGLHAQLIDGLEALGYGDTPSIFAPVKEGRKRGYFALKLQLRAVAHVEFRSKVGATKLAALELVGDAFGQGFATVKQWESRLRAELGEIVVAETLSRARLTGKRVREARRPSADRQDPLRELVLAEADLLYSNDALERDGEAFKRVLRGAGGDGGATPL
jgi:hypothetical protein